MPHARHAGHMYRTHTHVTYRPYVCSRCRCVKQICAVKLIFVYPFLLFHFSKNNLVPTGSTLHGATALGGGCAGGCGLARGAARVGRSHQSVVWSVETQTDTKVGTV